MAPIDSQTTLTLVGVGPHDLEIATSSVVANAITLILRRVLLVLRRHPNVFSSPHPAGLLVNGFACAIEVHDPAPTGNRPSLRHPRHQLGDLYRRTRRALQ
ncbi:hypothetical protein BVIET440_20004 [Burkholderia vietnamiensis]